LNPCLFDRLQLSRKVIDRSPDTKKTKSKPKPNHSNEYRADLKKFPSRRGRSFHHFHYLHLRDRSSIYWITENLPPTTSIAIIGGGPIATIEDRVRKFLEPSGSQGAVSFNGGMPLILGSRGWSGQWITERDSPNLLESWPRSIDLSESDRRQFCDVYCLWATNEMTKRAGVLA
jgi:hypothetical protein